MPSSVPKIARALVLTTLVGATPLLAGCASPIVHFIVTTRNHQGDLALANKNYTDAALAYKLALRVAPNDEHARSGLAAVQLEIAALEYQRSQFDDALAALALAAKYDPDSVRLAELKLEVEQARVKREIVVSNYPTYSETGLALRKSYANLKKESSAIVTTLQRFDYSYDSTELRKAITESNLLNTEVAHLTARLVSYRQLVESGTPEKANQSTLAPAASLLPLP